MIAYMVHDEYGPTFPLHLRCWSADYRAWKLHENRPYWEPENEYSYGAWVSSAPDPHDDDCYTYVTELVMVP